jgi:hypothetical protein
MKLAYFSAVVACFSLPLHKLDAQTFWEGSAFGMSDEQVKKLFPDAHAP